MALRTSCLHPSATVLLIAAGAITASALGYLGTLFGEVEPNDDKAHATPVYGMVAGDALFGEDFGTFTHDYFDVQVAPGPLALVENSLQVTWFNNYARPRIHGLEVSQAQIQPGTDVTVQESTVGGLVKWYGFGKAERLYYDAGDFDGQRTIYDATLETAPVQVTPIAGTFPVGGLWITSSNVGHNNDTDFWVYDDKFNPVPEYGNDDSLNGPQGDIYANYPAGLYYLAISDGNLANDEPVPFFESAVSRPVLDFPDAVICSSEVAPLDVSFKIGTFSNNVTVAATKTSPFEIRWFSIQVGTGDDVEYVCDGTSGCPCGNDGVAPRTEGCTSSTGRGGRLVSNGSTGSSWSAFASSLPIGQPALLFAGTSVAGGGMGSPFGDGVLCVGGTIQRLEVRNADELGRARWDYVPVSAGWTAGDVRVVQVWYRDPSGSPCGTLFNLTNALRITVQ